MPDPESYWQREARWRDRWHATALPPRADFVVIGGGLAGLTTAIRLRERNRDAVIVLLEAERVGAGASGRSAGFLSPLAAPVWLLGAERSPDQAWAAARINADIHALAAWIAAHVPAAELQPARLALVGTSRVADAAVHELARAVERVGLAHQLAPSRAWPGRTALALDAYTLHPYRLVRGLAEHAAAAGVIVRERARVEAITAGVRVQLAGGAAITARKVVACTNAYTGALDLGDRFRALPVHTFMAATAPLAVAALRRDGDFVVEVSVAQPYHRLHRDRLLFGAIDQRRAPAARDFARLAHHLHARFPAATVEHAWSGAFHATPTGLPILRASARDPAVLLNVGYGGTGVALALACAPLAAAIADELPFATADDARLLAILRTTRISPRDAVRAVARIAHQLAQPWLRG